MCAATGELDKGIGHYKKAMALGVQDERNIGTRFYADHLMPHPHPLGDVAHDDAAGAETDPGQ